jgi:ABC-type sugar transport system ATPase subunit
MGNNGEQILYMEGISKWFGGVHALNDIHFDLNYGDVHALVGENGAGKSTLIKVLGGIVPRNEGKITYQGQEVEFVRPRQAQEAGIAIIHQELSLMPDLNVIENIFMGRMNSRFGIIDWKELERRTLVAMSVIDLHVDPYAAVRDLSISERQMIEIASALSADANLIVMDEPNASLSESETETLFQVIAALKERGIAIIYVSHKIEEVLRISDRITVLRDGKFVDTVFSADTSEQQVVNMMVGRELDRYAYKESKHLGDVLLEVRDLGGKRFQDVSFNLRRGEILAFSGLIGAGRSEVMRAVFGAEPHEKGEILFEGRQVRFSSPKQAIEAGMGMVPEDRKVLSLFMEAPTLKNVSVAELPFMTSVIINERAEREMVNGLVDQLDIRLFSVDQPVNSLSGGNQQKTVLARWLATEPKLLILDEPTHGVDVGAKSEIYALMRQLAENGMGIVLISSELPEVLALGHRIVVMHEGRITGIVDHDEATEENLMAYATGLADDYAPVGAAEAT